ncbi:MAG: siroheme synthase CysG [Alphaproteobacteria bacterium]|nr:siroheme synthase CysG [Alphaproteobacteria bacterium]
MEGLPGLWRARGRDALLIGGGETAARKLRFLLRAGARVRVFPTGEALHDEVSAAIDTGAAVRVDRPVCAADGAEALLAIVAVEDEIAARAAIAVLKAARVPVNAVDRPEACDFLFPAVVDRGPVVIGISTGGAAPVLARRVRAAVESVLPARLGRLAEVAAGLRGAVKAMIPDDPGCRRFWEAFFDGPAADVLAGEEGRAREAALKLLNGPAAQAPAHGRVVIVGAGPGDPDLLTLKALQAMQRADVVLHDSLIGPQILDYVRRDAERIAVGKRKGAHSLTQDTINALMARHAAAGRVVVRLKGGDPFVFGRGGEEKAFLEARGVPVEIVPGVTAAVGAGAVAGIPLTHREDAQSVTFATGWFKGGAPDLDWSALARPGQTLAVYMGVGTAGVIAERLIAHGAPADRPAAVVEKATLPDQRVLIGRLDGLARLIAERQVAGPALLIVGDVVRRADAARLAETAPQAVARSA